MFKSMSDRSWAEVGSALACWVFLFSQQREQANKQLNKQTKQTIKQTKKETNKQVKKPLFDPEKEHGQWNRWVIVTSTH